MALGVSLATIRQWFFPAAFRIAPPSLPADLLTTLIALAAAQATPPTPAPAPQMMQQGIAPSALADVAVGLWRLREKMVQPGSDLPQPDMQRAFRAFESTWSALQSAGIRVQAHTGEKYVAGMVLSVLAFQPTPGLQVETIIETLKPSIYFHNTLIQLGEVIVGTPERDEAAQQTVASSNTPPTEN